MMTPHSAPAPLAHAAPFTYPPELAAELRQIEGLLHCISGRTLAVRVIHPDDAQRLQAFHERLSIDSIVFRFFRYFPTLPDADAQRFTHVDYARRMALVAVELAPGATEPVEDSPLAGVVRYEQTGSDVAEVAFIVADRWQGQGIATALLHRLAAYARRRSMTTFVAITMGTNTRMLDVLQHAGYPTSMRHESGDIAVTLDITRPAPGEPTITAE